MILKFPHEKWSFSKFTNYELPNHIDSKHFAILISILD